MANDGNKTQRSATALQYEGKQAPTVTAQGHAELADEIVALAREHGVLVHQDEELSKLLTKLELGEQIQPCAGPQFCAGHLAMVQLFGRHGNNRDLSKHGAVTTIGQRPAAVGVRLGALCTEASGHCAVGP